MVNYKTETTVSTVKLDSKLGMDIYSDIQKFRGVSNTIKLSKYDPENIMIVDRELDRILKSRGVTEIIKPAVYDEKTGKLKEDAIYQDVEIKSDILDVKTILKDFPLEDNE